MSTILWPISIWSKLERWKISISGCLMSWPKIKKKKNQKEIISLLLSCATTMNHFMIGLWFVTKSIYHATTGDNKLSGWTMKKLQSTSQSQIFTPKKIMVTVWWSPLDHYSSLNPGRNHYTWEVCSATRWKWTCWSCIHVQLFETPWNVAHQAPL